MATGKYRLIDLRTVLDVQLVAVMTEKVFNPFSQSNQ
jgi:hypothetical protein